MTEDEQLIEDIMNRESKLTEWELNFISSLSEQLHKGLTERQKEKLDKIWVRVT